MIWNRRPTYANILFFIARYASLAWAILFILGLHIEVHNSVVRAPSFLARSISLMLLSPAVRMYLFTTVQVLNVSFIDVNGFSYLMGH